MSYGQEEIRHLDSPKDVERANESYFEAALVEVGAHWWNQDRVLGVFKFGWMYPTGASYLERCHEPGARPDHKDFGLQTR